MTEVQNGHEPEGGDAFTRYFACIEERQRDINLAAITLGGRELHILAAEIIYELEALNPYKPNEEVCISGLALMPDMDEDSDGDDDDWDEYGEDELSFSIAVLERNDDETVYGRVEGVRGEYQGCVIQKYQGEYGMEYRIRHAVIVGRGSSISGRGTRISNDTLMGFFEHGSTIQQTDEIESTLSPSWDDEDLESEDVNHIINTYSVEAVTLLNSRMFRRLAFDRQQALLQSLIIKAEEESRVRDRYVSIYFTEPNADDHVPDRQNNRPPRPTRHIYVPHDTAEGFRVRRQNRIPVSLGGICVGIESLERLHLRNRPVRKRADLHDKRAGLCLVVDPDPDTTQEVDVNPDQLIYVPVSGQRFEADFAPR